VQLQWVDRQQVAYYILDAAIYALPKLSIDSELILEKNIVSFDLVRLVLTTDQLTSSSQLRVVDSNFELRTGQICLLLLTHELELRTV